MKSELTRLDLFNLIKGVNISLDEGIRLEKLGYIKISGINPDLDWVFEELNKLSNEGLWEFYCGLKKGNPFWPHKID